MITGPAIKHVDDVVGDDDGKVELSRLLLELGSEDKKFGGTAAGVVGIGAEKGSGGVEDEEANGAAGWGPDEGEQGVDMLEKVEEIAEGKSGANEDVIERGGAGGK